MTKVAAKGSRKVLKAIDMKAQHDAHVASFAAASLPLTLALPAPLASIPADMLDAVSKALEGEIIAPDAPLSVEGWSEVEGGGEVFNAPAIVAPALQGEVEGDDDATHEGKVSVYLASLMRAFDDRKAYQASKDADNLTIQAKLDTMQKALHHNRVAEIMMIAGCDANRINRAESKAARYNVYAYEKDINIARTIAAADSLNHYTLAIFKSLANLHKAGLTLTQEDAYAAVKLSQKVAPAKKPYIVKYDRCDVATGTMTTQASSSLNALQSFDIIKETTRGVFALNVESEATLALMRALAA